MAQFTFLTILGTLVNNIKGNIPDAIINWLRLRSVYQLVVLVFLLLVVIKPNLAFAQAASSASCPDPTQCLSQLDLDSIHGDWVNWSPLTNTSACALTGFGGSLDQFLQAEALIESGGNPTAGNPAFASGKYQFEPGTWQSWAKSYYGPAQQFPYAAAAPENIQDAVMYIGSVVRYNKVAGDFFAMAAAHYGGDSYLVTAHNNHNDPKLNQTPGTHNTVTVAQYANLVVSAIVGGNYHGKSLSSVTLSYQTAPDFQTWLAKNGGAAAAGSSSSSSAVSSCGTGVPAGQFVFYNQCDTQWGATPYGDKGSTICSSGCGPTSVAMVVATLIDKTVTPPIVAAWSMGNGGWVPGSGSSWSGLLINGPIHWGLHAHNLGLDMNQAISILNSGGLVLAAGGGAAPFTLAGHILVLRGVAPDGNILVGDPDTAHTATEYSPATIMGAGLGDLVGVTK